MGELIPLFPLGSPLFPGVVLPLQVFEPRYRRLVADLVALPAGSERRFFGVVAIRQGWEVERVSPAEALYDIGTTAVLRAVTPQPDGGFRIVTVGGARFRLLDVHVADDPPYLQADVEWLADEEAAEEAAGNSEGLPAGALPAGTDPGDDEVAREVARGSMTVLCKGVRDLFARYATEVALLQGGALEDDDETDLAAMGDAVEQAAADLGLAEGQVPGLDPEAAELLRTVGSDPTALSYLVASAALLTTEDRQALLAESATRRRLASESRMLRRELTLLRELGAVPVPLQQFAGPLTMN